MLIVVVSFAKVQTTKSAKAMSHTVQTSVSVLGSSTDGPSVEIHFLGI